MAEGETIDAQSRDANKTLEVLFEISSAVNSTLTLEELYPEIHRSLGKILNVENLFIALHNESRDSITFPYYIDQMDDPHDEIVDFSATPSLTGKVILAAKPLVFFEKEVAALYQSVQDQREQSFGTVPKIWLGAPLIIRNKVIGVIAIQSYTSANAYGKKDLDLLNSISQHIALAIERKESDEKLNEQKLLLEKILESSPVAITLVENRVFKWVNNEMLKMFGYQHKDEIENKSVQMIYESVKDYEQVGEMIAEDLMNKSRADFDFDLIRKDGSVFSAHIVISSMNPLDLMASTIVTISDISERKIAQQERLEREKLQGVLEMAGAVCHELNQPLQAIIGYASLYENPNDLTGKDFNSIKEQVVRIGEITRKLSNITHYQTTTYPGNKTIVDIWGSSKNSN